MRQICIGAVILLQDLKTNLTTGLLVLSSTELSELWTKHSAALLLVAKGHCASVVPGLAEDCVQDAFIKLAVQTPAPDSAVAWLMTCVRTTSIDAIRSHKRRTHREHIAANQAAAWFEPPALPCPDDTVELQKALQQLDSETRDIVIGHLWNDMTFRQLAKVIDLSSATIHRRYEQGLEQLKQLMTSSHPTEAESLK